MAREAEAISIEPAERTKYLYPRWPWWKPVEWLRIAFVEAVAQPLVRFLANPRVVGGVGQRGAEPMLDHLQPRHRVRWAAGGICIAGTDATADGGGDVG